MSEGGGGDKLAKDKQDLVNAGVANGFTVDMITFGVGSLNP